MPLSNATVTIRSVVATVDELGDGTTVTTDTVLDWALVAPRSSSERADQRAPAVVSAATVYGPFSTPVDADDVIVIADHSPTMDGVWLVEGIPGGWSLNGWEAGVEVAVRRAGPLEDDGDES